MSVEPTAHDVLSGLGAWLNQHPGNAHFRKIIEEQKSIYVAGTKKQKMNISKAIVEAIYSKEPPGRFLKKCPETGQWKELSTKEVAEKVTQSMSCAARGNL
ncbi:hypothetical protein QTG54_016574 [Skeletonema marinoi]|uniref:DUF6824 domain-containing protein n=1 Tax=Skeletonema marinoi TaxID=267567 RepID=A0AAD8XSJ0_9STRA|nr:hypothetical protein QTG54_016574 [Skeletonema marinoi]